MKMKKQSKEKKERISTKKRFLINWLLLVYIFSTFFFYFLFIKRNSKEIKKDTYFLFFFFALLACSQASAKVHFNENFFLSKVEWKDRRMRKRPQVTVKVKLVQESTLQSMAINYSNLNKPTGTSEQTKRVKRKKEKAGFVLTCLFCLKETGPKHSVSWFGTCAVKERMRKKS